MCERMKNLEVENKRLKVLNSTLTSELAKVNVDITKQMVELYHIKGRMAEVDKQKVEMDTLLAQVAILVKKRTPPSTTSKPSGESKS